MTESYIDIKLSRLDRVYRPNEKVDGTLNVYAYKGWSHTGINMVVEGLIYMSHSNRGFVGIGGDLASRPTQILKIETNVIPAGKFPDGLNEVPFSFFLNPLPGQALFESYHGVYVSIVYTISIVCERGVMKKALSREVEFLVEIPTKLDVKDPLPVNFQITPESLENVNSKIISSIPKFSISGRIHRSKCPINQPLTGEVTVEFAGAPVKSLELQLVRVETVNAEGKCTKEATEIQNIQIGDGNVCRNLTVPIYMVFPRLFSCSTVNNPSFKIEFEVNLIMVYGDGYMVTENFPLILYRDANIGN